jgi:hypothetical protein
MERLRIRSIRAEMLATRGEKLATKPRTSEHFDRAKPIMIKTFGIAARPQFWQNEPNFELRGGRLWLCEVCQPKELPGWT